MEKADRRPISPRLSSHLERKLIFISGKGGVGKTLVSQSIAWNLAKKGKQTLWATFEDPTLALGEKNLVAPNLWHLNLEASRAFEEYAAMKLGGGKLTRIFVQNKLMRYMAKAAPGIHELVLLGKAWWERLNYDHVVIDMPSTGYGLTMFQSAKNFSSLFRGGPIQRDADAMITTFNDPQLCAHIILALPEEMPLIEALDLDAFLKKHFPNNPACLIANRVFPEVPGGSVETGPSPVVKTRTAYAENRSALEVHNLRLWRDLKIDFDQIPYLIPESPQRLIEKMGSFF